MSMVKTLSRRALRAIMEARLEAGKRGATSIDANSLVIGLITEDQNPTSMDLNEQDPIVKKFREREPKPLAVGFPPSSWIKREAFFSPEVAADLLAKLNDMLPKSGSVPGSASIPTSPEFDRVLGMAEELRQERHRVDVEPLDLLAAVLREPCEATRMLQDAGIAKERVQRALENGPNAEQVNRLIPD